MNRGKPPVRHTPLRSRRAPKRTRRPAAEFARIYGGTERVLWIQRQQCVVTGEWPCVTVHVKTGGVSRKADSCWTVPMVPEKHEELHRIGVRSFEARYNIDLALAAIATEQAWQAYRVRFSVE